MYKIDKSKIIEPKDFDEKCRKKGSAWLSKHKDDPDFQRKLPAYWKGFLVELSKCYKNRCAYSAVFIPTEDGAIDHFEPKSKYPQLAYEWSNFRFIGPLCNSLKNDRGSDEILDPLLVEDDWFRIILPSLQLTINKDKIPQEYQQLAQNTIKLPHLDHDERFIVTRQAWLSMYQEGNITLHGLYRVAPLLAKAIEEQQLNSTPE